MPYVFPDIEELSEAAAEVFVQRSIDAIETYGTFRVVLAGGNTPKRTYDLLAEPRFRDRVRWENVEVFWGDERCVPISDARSNAGMAKQALLDRVAIPDGQIHVIPGAEPASVAASMYEDLLRCHFGSGRDRFDLVFLGLGEDGHTASLFPQSQAVEERSAWVTAITPGPDGIDRVSLTAPRLNQTETAVFLVAGEKKAEALRRVLRDSPDPRTTPAVLIRPASGRIAWFVDAAAGALVRSDAKDLDEEPGAPGY